MRHVCEGVYTSFVGMGIVLVVFEDFLEFRFESLLSLFVFVGAFAVGLVEINHVLVEGVVF